MHLLAGPPIISSRDQHSLGPGLTGRRHKEEMVGRENDDMYCWLPSVDHQREWARSADQHDVAIHSVGEAVRTLGKQNEVNLSMNFTVDYTSLWEELHFAGRELMCQIGVLQEVFSQAKPGMKCIFILFNVRLQICRK